MKLQGNITCAAVIVLLLFTSPAYSHTTVTDTIPRSGSVLEQSPPVVEIRFDHSARLTSVVLIEADKTERRLTFTPATSTTSFKLPDPNLGPGRNEIRWNALSGDGHVISGTLFFIIEPGDAKTD